MSKRKRNHRGAHFRQERGKLGPKVALYTKGKKKVVTRVGEFKNTKKILVVVIYGRSSRVIMTYVVLMLSTEVQRIFKRKM